MATFFRVYFLFMWLLTISSAVTYSSYSSLEIHNRYHDYSCFENDSLTPKRSKSVLSLGIVQEVVIGVIFVLVLINVVVYKLRKLLKTSLEDDKNNNNDNDINNKKRPSSSSEQLCHRFTFAEMQKATNNFDESMIIGKGGFGKVYKGVIKNINGVTETVAIKRLDSKSKQGADEFWTEISMLSRCRHSHLVSLIGYCNEFNEMMVVYEYVPGGNLSERLNKKSSKYHQTPPLSWVERLKICVGAARALDYLHTGTGTRHRIIHRDVKSSNILLDDDKAAKLSDLGVSKIGPVDQACTHVSTDVKGSFGYFDPNYFMTRRLTRKSDVYSFGVVLLEVLCGRPPFDPIYGDSEIGLVGWAQQCIKEGDLNNIIDPSLMGLTPCLKLKGQIMPNCLKVYVEICVKCLQARPKERPTMAEVVVALETALALQHGGQLLVVDKEESVKSGKLLTLSRMVKNMLPAKNPVRSTVTHSNRERKSEDTSKKVIVADSALKKFTLDRLKIATRNFSDDMVLGEGAFGKVFKGWVEQGTCVPSKAGFGIPIAVKKLDTDGYQGLEEWQTEVEIMGKLNHPNLVKLLGYCSQDNDLLLVYEYMSNGSLENYILKQGLGTTLSWSMRVKILVGVAQAIAFLHNTDNQIMFRDLKTSNILLDQEFNAKISDFGLARRGPINDETHVSTRVMGTYGYAAPEYVATGYLNGKNDIYAFGVVLLETLTGLRVFDKTRPINEQNLVEWMRPMLPNKKKLKAIVDPSLGQDYRPQAAYQWALLILKCTQPEPQERPSIEQVLRSLERTGGVKTKMLKGKFRYNMP
ncbi:uncharacterized protein [Rutidosis leptorrhynchoides]|uniref:uncharacterized protein n=1 Tax=Rutidosis leptorrhynchoides TaxID=125765 RepID=UPI003A99DB6F